VEWKAQGHKESTGMDRAVTREQAHEAVRERAATERLRELRSLLGVTVCIAERSLWWMGRYKPPLHLDQTLSNGA
jgi:hypothetical protein